MKVSEMYEWFKKQSKLGLSEKQIEKKFDKMILKLSI